MNGCGADLFAVGPQVQCALSPILGQIAQDHNPDRDNWVINVFGHVPHAMLGRSPCLARARAGAGGHCLSSESRLFTTEGILSLQCMPAVAHRKGISNRQMEFIVGKTIPVNVLRRLIVRLLPGVSLKPPRIMPSSKWS